MGKIQLLDDLVINKIAAGEVVARPANVVKELVENSIDAGSSEIHIEIVEGGQQSIRISDNGVGMSGEDCKMSLRRHATSKIASSDDLFSIATMGFRGEALASISAVSRLNLCSKRQDYEGCQLLSEGGEILQQQPWSGKPHGTIIGVRDLFYNVPARAKFLRATTTEFAHCLEIVQALSIAHPGISFSIKHNGKLRYESAAVEDYAPIEVEGFSLFGEKVLRTKAGALLGDHTAQQLRYVHEASTYGSFEALISPPGYEKATNKHTMTYVNGRWVKDRVLLAGIHRGYQSHILKGRYPVVIGFLRMDPGLIDVNVHPAKTEMRLQYPGEIQSLIASTIRTALREAAWAEFPSETVQENKLSFQNLEHSASPGLSESFASAKPSRVIENPALSGKPLSPTNFTTKTRETYSGANTASLAVQKAVGTEKSEERIPWENLSFIGTIFQCYLLFEGGKGLFSDRSTCLSRENFV